MSEETVEVINESQLLVREAPFTLEGDGRTIEARILPFNQDARVADAPERGGTGIPYLERWLPGSFAKQADAANRVEVWLNFEHEQGIRGVVGHGVALREAPDALYGTFRVHPGLDGDKALHMVNEGILTGLSVEAIPKVTHRTRDGVVERAKAILNRVSLCRIGIAAYPGAEVLAVREAPPPDDDPPPSEPPSPLPERTSEVDEMLARVGFEPITAVTVSHRLWNLSPENYEDADAYARACLIDTNPEGERDVAHCWLPVYEPGGDLNTNALEAAAKRINHAPMSERPAAARKLLRLYRTASMDAPLALRQLASR